MNKDPFGFEKAIEIDHLTTEQLEMVNEIFKDFKY